MGVHLQISTTTTRDNIELLSDIFSELGALAVSLIDAKDEPLFQSSPQDNPHWQHTTLRALFDSHISAENIVETIKNNFPQFQSCDFTIEKIANKNWIEETQRQFKIQSFGSLWICPLWEKKHFLKSYSKETVVFIEPGLAFGTGTHPTTQLCLTWLSHNIKHSENACLIDYGCGSGILALAACALGVTTVYAIDHDPQALQAVQNNMAYNQFTNSLLHVRKTNELEGVKANIIIANILANPLIALAPILTALLAPNGKLILSGMLQSDVDRVLAVYQSHFTRLNIEQQDEWALMTLQLLGGTR